MSAALLVLAVAFLLALPAMAFARTEAPGFVYAKALRGHIVVVNWEPPLNDTDQNMTYRIYRASGSSLPAFPGAAWQLAGTTDKRWQTAFNDAAPKDNSARYWYVVTAQSSTDTESLASPVNSPGQGWGTGAQLQSYYYLPTNQATSFQRYIGPYTLPPIEPTGISTSGADEEITIEWDPVPSTNIVRYHVYRCYKSGSAIEEMVKIGEVAGSPPATVFVDTAVERYRHYWYRIIAEDSTGAIGLPSIEVHFRTVASTGPAAPHTPADNPWEGDTCLTCHDIHVASGPVLLKVDQDTEVELCITCHDGTGSRYDVRREFTDAPVSGHMVAIGEGQGDFTCVDCHSPHGGEGLSSKLLSVDGVTFGNGVCYGSGCHGEIDPVYGLDFSVFDTSIHNTEMPGPESGTEVRCSTCHQPHASPNPWLWTSVSYRACFQCHAGGGIDLGSPDIYTRITLSSDPDTQHDVLLRDQVANGTFMACQNCHNTHAVTRERPLVDPWSPGISPGEQWDEDRNAPLAVADASPNQPRYNEFCIACHGSAGLPQAQDTLPWVDPPADGGHLTKNIETDWANRVHGRQSAGGAVLDPIMGYANGQTLSCMTCHEAHGTANNYNLRSDVPDITGGFPKQNLLLVQVLDASGNPVAEAYDTRFFCSSCHLRTTTSPVSHDSTNVSQPKTYRYFPNGCTNRACHAHESTGNRRF